MEPLPEMALRNIRGRSWAGTSRAVSTGASSTSIRLSMPDEVRLFMAMNMPMRKGIISTAVFKPFFAPSMNRSYMGARFQRPYPMMTALITGRKPTERKVKTCDI